MKFDPMATNSRLLNMKPLISFNYSPSIHKSSIFYTSIQIYQYYKSLQQGGGETAMFLYYWSIIHKVICPFDMINLWIEREYYLNNNKKLWIKRISLKNINGSPKCASLHRAEIWWKNVRWEGEWDESWNVQEII